MELSVLNVILPACLSLCIVQLQSRLASKYRGEKDAMRLEVETETQ